MPNNNRAQAEELARAPYLIRVDRDQTPEGERVYVAYIVDMETCIGQGDTYEEAVADVRLALADFIEGLLDRDLNVPRPSFVFGVSPTPVISFRSMSTSEEPMAEITPPEGVTELRKIPA